METKNDTKLSAAEYITKSDDPKKAAILTLQKGFIFGHSVFNSYRNDKDVVMAAVTRNGENLKYASDRLKDDKEIVLTAVKQSGRALYYASKKLKDNKEIVMEAAKSKSFCLIYISKRLNNDKEVVLEALKNNKYNVRFLSKDIEELCEGSDPVKTLESFIAHEKLKSQIASKPKQEIKKTLKI